jgi:hypothetical protein
LNCAGKLERSGKEKLEIWPMRARKQGRGYIAVFDLMGSRKEEGTVSESLKNYTMSKFRFGILQCNTSHVFVRWAPGSNFEKYR